MGNLLARMDLPTRLLPLYLRQHAVSQCTPQTESVAFANHDALTKIENFAAYKTAINYQVTSSRKNGSQLTMLMFDSTTSNKSTTIMVTWLAQILQHVAQVATIVFHANNPQISLYRTGGEEFNVIFPTMI